MRLEQGSMPVNKRPVLLIGLPRSGTTWISEVLRSARGARFVFEPDNEKLSAIAWVCKQSLHRFPYLAREDRAPAYERLWSSAMADRPLPRLANKTFGLFLKQRSAGTEAGIGEKTGYVYVDAGMHTVGNAPRKDPYAADGHPLPASVVRLLLARSHPSSGSQRLILKSVHAALSADWIAARFPVDIVLILRNPGSLFASYKRMRMPDGYRNLVFQDTLRRDLSHFVPRGRLPLLPESADSIIFQIMLMNKVIQKQLAVHPEWLVISHDRLSIAPQDGYRRVFDRLGLSWDPGTDKKIGALDRPGQGFETRRISSEQPTKWKREIPESEQRVLRKWTDYFELGHFFRENVELE